LDEKEDEFCILIIIKAGLYLLRNFQTQKWVSMFLSYLVDIFLVIFRLRIFFGFEILFKRKLFEARKSDILVREFSRELK
jgi:hypothetical protein